MDGFPHKQFAKPAFQKVNDHVWDIPTTFKKGMRVPARIIASKPLLDQMDLMVFDQLTNVATLPGIIDYSFCMPDGHSGYGFSIGGVAAMDTEKGVISPGGIGFDINCGVRMVKTNLTFAEVRPKIRQLTDLLFQRVPAGVGSSGFVKLNASQFRTLVEEGARWAVAQGYGWEEDLALTEEEGCIAGADQEKISNRAIQRGLNQIGTLGSGNHYLEIQVVKEENIADPAIAKRMGIFPEQVVVMFHCGSRGFGHQVATDYLELFLSVMERKYKIQILDRELACAPFQSKEGQDYFAAMKGGINMSFANRQTILHRIRECFSATFNRPAEEMGLRQVYDVAHNTAKLEDHIVQGKKQRVLMHRKGATRAFGPGRKEIPPVYRDIGQPVLIGGSMETGSYLLLGTEGAEKLTFASTCHGSGRTMSRTQARRQWHGQKLQEDMEKRGIYVRTTSFPGLAEEAGGAYKDIDEVIQTADRAGISKSVVRLGPVANVKG
ncbi:MAG: RtcB family protein [Candidatus Aenigmarchaeota archaeon]|nr:RtcB family protein [Candidatus Aenigmarchaeota archaeon]